VVPVRVQGEQATAEIIEALDIINKQLDVDVIVITRGGGSLEDLWPFNSAELAYAIRNSSIPVVSAVGHEIDTTICDLAADLRAPTPSAAAEMLVREKDGLRTNLTGLVQRMLGEMNHCLNTLKERLESLKARLKDPRRNIQEHWLRLDEVIARLNNGLKWRLERERKRFEIIRLGMLKSAPQRQVELQVSVLAQRVHSMCQAMEGILQRKRASVENLRHRVEDLSPLSILDRGYSITMKLPKRDIIRSHDEVKVNEQVGIILGAGSLLCSVESRSEEKFQWIKRKN